MIHWSMVMALAAIGCGLPKYSLRAERIKAFSASWQTALDHVEKIYTAGTASRNELLQNQSILFHVLDNYQRVHRKGNQINGKSAIMHCGTCFSSIRAKVPKLPIGTIMKSPANVSFVVTSSELTDCYHCSLQIILQNNNMEINHLHPYDRFHLNEGLVFPAVGWTVSHIPGVSNNNSEITYLNQIVPPSLYFTTPVTCNGDDIIFSDRT